MNTTQVAARRRAIAAEANDIASATAKSSAERWSALKALEAEVKRLDEADEVNARAASIGNWERSSDAEAKAAARGPLTFAPDQAEALFKSAQNRQPVAIKSIGTGNVAPSTYSQQHLPPVLPAREGTRVLDLLPTTATTSGVVEWYTTVGTSAAAPVAEGGVKPESTMTMARVFAAPTKIAHIAVVTEEALADFPSFQRLLTADLTAGIIAAESAALLNGVKGTPAAQTFDGLLKVAGTQSYARTADDTILDALEIAATNLRAGGRFTEADGIVMSPRDFSRARRVKDANGAYLAGNPATAPAGTLWGLPVAISSTLADGKALVGNFAEAAQVWVREGISVRVDPYTRSTTNEVILIAETRLTLGVLAPSALSVVTLTAPTA